MSPTAVMIVIPCFNEAASITTTIRELPSTLKGVPVRILVVDDGSTDGSAQLAASTGAAVLQIEHGGLGHAIRAGLHEATQSGAQVIVTLDADGQYDPAVLEALVTPLLEGRADVAFGERNDQDLVFTGLRRWLHVFGCTTVRTVTRLPLRDLGTGCRAYTAQIASRLEIASDYDHTLETLFQLQNLRARVVGTPVRSRMVARTSRLASRPIRHALIEAYLFLWAWWHYGPTAKPRSR